MTYAQFQKILSLLRDQYARESAISEYSIQLSEFNESIHIANNLLLQHIFGEVNGDLIVDFILGQWSGNIWDSEGNVIADIRTDKDLWKHLEKEGIAVTPKS